MRKPAQPTRLRTASSRASGRAATQQATSSFARSKSGGTRTSRVARSQGVNLQEQNELCDVIARRFRAYTDGRHDAAAR